MGSLEVRTLDKPIILSRAALESGVNQFIGLVQSGRLTHWLVEVDVYVDTSGWGRKRAITSFDVNLVPTRESDSSVEIELNEGSAVLESLDDVIDFLSQHEIRWLDEQEAREATESMKNVY